MFVVQETPPYLVNSPSAASNQQNDRKIYEEKDNTEKGNGGEHVESLPSGLHGEARKGVWASASGGPGRSEPGSVPEPGSLPNPD